MKRVWIAALLLACVSLPGCKDKSRSSRDGGESEDASGYAASEEGLKKQVSEIRAEIKAGRLPKAQSLVDEMKLPDPQRWFERYFGAEKAPALAAEYQAFLVDWKQVGDLFDYHLDKGDAAITVVRVDSKEDRNASGAQRSALAAMKWPVPLYRVELGQPTGRSVWSFVYVDGKFRLVGKMRAVSRD